MFGYWCLGSAFPEMGKELVVQCPPALIHTSIKTVSSKHTQEGALSDKLNSVLSLLLCQLSGNIYMGSGRLQNSEPTKSMRKQYFRCNPRPRTGSETPQQIIPDPSKEMNAWKFPSSLWKSLHMPCAQPLKYFVGEMRIYTDVHSKSLWAGRSGDQGNLVLLKLHEDFICNTKQSSQGPKPQLLLLDFFPPRFILCLWFTWRGQSRIGENLLHISPVQPEWWQAAN